MREVDKSRIKTLAKLIAQAREYAGRSIEDCADILGISPEQYIAIEQAELLLSLPELESLALYLKVPMAFFWGSQQLKQPKAINFQQFIELRHRVIGALLRQSRIEAGRSLRDVADYLEVPLEQVQRYEMGAEVISLFHLEQIGKFLSVSLDYFMDDQRGPLSQHEAEQKVKRRFEDLAPEVKAFVTEPINISYLETAMKLSKLDVQRLRNIAEGILDITF